MKLIESWRVAIVILMSFGSGAYAQDPPDLQDRLADLAALDGFIPLLWDEQQGKLFMQIENMGEDFLYQSSMPRGIGSNDLLLDRGQLGNTHVVRFFRSGPRVLLIADNLYFRATSDDLAEQAAVEQSFAESVLWGFPVELDNGDSVLVDATGFFLRDAHDLSTRLSRSGQGSYSVDPERSAIYLPRTRSFPDNSEVEAIMTYTGQPQFNGDQPNVLPSVVPDPTAITVHLHHSLVRLPDSQYTPVPFDPRAGYIGSPSEEGYIDYSSEVGSPMRTAYARTHRLEKQDPTAEISDPVEPIVYYVDPGTPEPIRSALVDGANWWNQAFEAAGYRDAFRVEILPVDADPMDVRFNVIQWVHRSTRGWSYGGSVVDPRTGEIIKGHVTLGSLRVRQDYLIAEGLLSPYGSDEVPGEMLEMSLARIRQLSAHEVGHTLGIAHNFAASTQGRSSVMDYPFPLIGFNEDGSLDLSDAYDTGIGEWDKRAILYGYQDFAEGVDESAARAAIVQQTIDSGLLFVDDADARDVGTAHPLGNLWDNGSDPLAELEHLLRVRQYALSRFSLHNIRDGRPTATLEEVLVPIYLLHRFQIEAAGKLLGGQNFSYQLRGDGQPDSEPVSASRQQQALDALLQTLAADFLVLPQHISALISPRPPGHSLGRESFARRTGAVFDPLSPAESAARLTLDVLLNRTRLERMNRASLADSSLPSASTVLRALVERTWQMDRENGARGAVQRIVASQVLNRLYPLAIDSRASSDLRAQALAELSELQRWLERVSGSREDKDWKQFLELARFDIRRYMARPGDFDPTPPPVAPPGSPIGGG
ncbi:MAG: DUF5117 domain-containing protein [Xanthomonadales bacterium]|nr:DUF5117 domain-containing protein [Xanthomonadales bacterium]